MTIIQKLHLFVRHHFTDQPYDGPAQDNLLHDQHRLGFDLATHYRFLKKLDTSFELTVLETISYEHQHFPIYCLDFQPGATGERLFVLAGSHGNEEAGLQAVEQYLEFLQTSGLKYKNIAVRIVTPHNPVGAAHFSRYNGQGIDLNRDFAKQNTVETRAVCTAFTHFQPTFAISLHEGPQTDGAFFFTNEYVTNDRMQPLLTQLQHSGIQLAHKSYFGNTLQTPGQFPATGIFQQLKRLWQFVFTFQGFGSYCAGRQIPALVMETSWTSADRAQRVGAQYETLATLTKLLTA